MVGLSNEQRRMLLDKLPDAANVVLGALGLGQLLSERPFSLSLSAVGIAGCLALFGLALWLAREESRD